jgi:hypothetical protein
MLEECIDVDEANIWFTLCIVFGTARCCVLRIVWATCSYFVNYFFDGIPRLLRPLIVDVEFACYDSPIAGSVIVMTSLETVLVIVLMEMLLGR